MKQGMGETLAAKIGNLSPLGLAGPGHPWRLQVCQARKQFEETSLF
jgi:hypothetical protein